MAVEQSIFYIIKWYTNCIIHLLHIHSKYIRYTFLIDY